MSTNSLDVAESARRQRLAEEQSIAAWVGYLAEALELMRDAGMVVLQRRLGKRRDSEAMIGLLADVMCLTRIAEKMRAQPLELIDQLLLLEAMPRTAQEAARTGRDILVLGVEE
jgi:hypothetical protein